MDIEKLRSQVKSMVGKTITHKTCSYFYNIDKSDAEKSEAIGDSEFDLVAVINTTNVIDSHMDLHLKGLWDESSLSGLSYIIDHDYSISSLIAAPQDVKAEVQSIRWKKLGLDINGTTDALVFKVKIKDYANESFIKAYKSGVPLQNSIRMRYGDVYLSVNNSEFKEEYANWNKYLKFAINPEKAIEEGYFFAVKTAYAFLEGSSVLRGSNMYTPLLEKQENTGDEPITNKNEGQESPKQLENLYSYYKTIH